MECLVMLSFISFGINWNEYWFIYGWHFFRGVIERKWLGIHWKCKYQNIMCNVVLVWTLLIIFPFWSFNQEYNLSKSSISMIQNKEIKIYLILLVVQTMYTFNFCAITKSHLFRVSNNSQKYMVLLNWANRILMKRMFCISHTFLKSVIELY